MTKKFHIALVMVVMGFFLTPTLTYACGMKSEKSCCSKEISSKGDKKDCCKKDDDSKNKSHDGGCNGKCGHSNCTTSSIQFGLAFFEIKFKNNNVVFSEKEQNYIHSETNISSGFHSIWLIPKIG
ncbi:MAG TPA: hypothetical protein VLR29_10870 [Flavobacterium sp.]|nr:hypothetical protein [Flavobacterium sp.]